MPVVQQGAINLNAASVPDVYVQITPPQQNYLNGVATDILGIVGTASWGPVNSPTTVSAYSDYKTQFGPAINRKYDLGRAVVYSARQGANNFRCVRVTDGTDVAASGTLGTTGLTLTAKYTGTVGNQLTATLSAGSAANSWRLVLALPGQNPETFDNLAAGLTGNAVWIAIAAAINSGAGVLRGPSQLAVAAAGASTAAPVAATVTLSGGTDGASGVTATQLIGTDGTARTGMYALRATGCANAFLADCDASTSWTTQVAYGLSEGTYMHMTGPAGDTIANAISTKATAGIDSYAAKLHFGDWCYVSDPETGVTSLMSPQAFGAGRKAAMSPEQSLLNKPLNGITATQKTNGNAVYSTADLKQLSDAGIDVITNPCPGGSYFGCRIGKNTSSNAAINGDNYAGVTNYLAYTLNAGMGKHIGRLQTPTQRGEAQGTINGFLSTMWAANMLGDVNNPTRQPFSVQLDANNNPSSQVAQGIEQIAVRATYLSVITTLVISVEGGQTVSINVVSATPA